MDKSTTMHPFEPRPRPPAARALPEALAGQQSSYFDPKFNAQIIGVAQGQYATSGREGEILSTVLGSCIAACLRDPLLKIGGINHFLLPGDSTQDDGVSTADMRFGGASMEVLINALLRQGANRKRLQAKVFGGANVLSGNHGAVGERNALFVQQFLKDEGITVLAKDLGGDRPRRVNFDPYHGRAWVNHLDAPRAKTVLEQERNYRDTLRVTPPVGTLEIF
jgi:chemotaxis protein CheD